ncbi:MAG: hypothetical protein A3H93_17250 [Rhodocyclales bacterium RIFCSPLOWO2_02_FULL_63_24]|nr:MAG: hypothetical protein A2040_16815 [Rhodocyclales bacterium GWA2_65_19]OHC68692.1 MAG: hypothetical protein A3H93_17250 [Rhodocyclales bacterium RIFCSPLOWO2_02_FULL_63_24]
MGLFRRILLRSALLIVASHSASSLAQNYPPYPVAILETTELPLNRQVVGLIDKKDLTQLQELLARGVDINRADYKGVRPIHYAAFLGSVEAMKLFAERGADLKANTFGGWTALHYAAFGGHRQVAEFLVAAGLPIDVRDSGGESPLFYAIQVGDLTMVHWLVSHGADINHENNGGDTPLSHAIEKQKPQIVGYLQKLGAKPAAEADKRD